MCVCVFVFVFGGISYKRKQSTRSGIEGQPRLFLSLIYQSTVPRHDSRKKYHAKPFKAIQRVCAF